MADTKKWPVFSEKELVLGNLDSRIGICTLWTPRNKFADSISGIMNRIAAIGNLFSIYGIAMLIRNFLANPNLRYLIVTGTEQGDSGKVLLNLNNSKDEKLLKRVYLDKEHIQRFLEQVKIIRVENIDVSRIIEDNLYLDQSYENRKFEPLFVELPEPKAEVFPSAKSGYLIRRDTIAEGYVALLDEIRKFGHITDSDSEGHRRQELWELNMVITDQNPIDFKSIPHPEYNTTHIRKYCEDFWKGAEPNDLAYRYGHIIRYEFGDQVEAVVNAFVKKPETFRTLISLWNPNTLDGSIVAEDPPCLVIMHPRIIGNLLHLWAYIRTNDMFSGWPLNAAALRYFQHKFLILLRVRLNRPELEIGELDITSGSAHLYERDWLRVDSMLEEVLKKGKFRIDRKGNFEISTECNEILIHHYSPDGTELLQTFRGTNAERLSLEISPFISETRNALYVGRELAKAELGLKKIKTRIFGKQRKGK